MLKIMAEARAETGGDDRHALRQTQLAGWYVRGGKWEQLAPNIQNKVQVRKAEKQPDGRFAIYNVPCFYPNAVKPQRDEFGNVVGATAFTAELIGQVCDNTNASIASGAQAPPLTLGHTNNAQTDRGIQLPANGRALNFRQFKNGMLFCDLLDVEPKFAADWMKGRMNGLSAAFVADAAGLNPRVGHVARLGGQAQALPHLPATEIYSGDQFAFAADAAIFPASLLSNPQSSRKGLPMLKKSQCFAQMSAAYAAKEANEPGWEGKVKEAETAYAAAMDDVADPTAAGVTNTPASVSPQTVDGFSAEAFAADPFGTIQGLILPLRTQVAALTATTVSLGKENAALKAKDRKASFALEVTELSKLHEFAAEDFIGQFDALQGNETALGATITALKKFPARARSLSDIGAVMDRTTAATAFSAPNVNITTQAMNYAADAMGGDDPLSLVPVADRAKAKAFFSAI